MKGKILGLALAAVLSFSPKVVEKNSGVRGFDVRRSLKASIENVISREHSAVRKENIAVGVYDLCEDSMLYCMNEKIQLQSASMVKPFVALAYYTGIEKKILKHAKDKDTTMIRKMIEESNNDATTYLMKRLGGPVKVERILKKNYPDISKRIDIVEYIPHSGKTYRNKSSVNDYLNFLNRLWDGRLSNSEQLLYHMQHTRFHRLTTEEMLPYVKSYNKTGSTAKLCGDMAIISYEDSAGLSFDYAVAVVIERPKGDSKTYSKWLRSRSEMMQEISNKIFEDMQYYHEYRREHNQRLILDE